MSKNYDLVLFDLDGTLTDPGEGITNSVAYALSEMGIQPPKREELYKFIGPPLLESFMRFFDMSQGQAEEAIRLYRVYFADRGIFENVAYPGVRELLEKLKVAGIGVALATSKPAVFAGQILEHFGLSEYFDFVVGSELDGTRSSKGEVIKFALELGARDGGYRNALMVGDRLHDIRGARENGIDSLGVLYGYGSRTELEEAGANYIVSCPDEILQYVL